MRTRIDRVCLCYTMLVWLFACVSGYDWVVRCQFGGSASAGCRTHIPAGCNLRFWSSLPDCYLPILPPCVPNSCHFRVHAILRICYNPLTSHWSIFQPNSMYKSKHARTRFAIRQLAVCSPPCIPYALHPVCYTRMLTLCLTTLPPVRDPQPDRV